MPQSYKLLIQRLKFVGASVTRATDHLLKKHAASFFMIPSRISILRRFEQ